MFSFEFTFHFFVQTGLSYVGWRAKGTNWTKAVICCSDGLPPAWQMLPSSLMLCINKQEALASVTCSAQSFWSPSLMLKGPILLTNLLGAEGLCLGLQWQMGAGWLMLAVCRGPKHSSKAPAEKSCWKILPCPCVQKRRCSVLWIYKCL